MQRIKNCCLIQPRQRYQYKNDDIKISETHDCEVNKVYKYVRNLKQNITDTAFLGITKSLRNRLKINYSFMRRIHGSYEERTLSNNFLTSSELFPRT